MDTNIEHMRRALYPNYRPTVATTERDYCIERVVCWIPARSPEKALTKLRQAIEAAGGYLHEDDPPEAPIVSEWDSEK